MSGLDLAISNLTSVSVLVFGLGFIAARFKSDVRIPEQVYQIISVYLLFGIGLKGGVALSHSGDNSIAKPVLATLFLGIVIPALAFIVLSRVRALTEIDRGARSEEHTSELQSH